MCISFVFVCVVVFLSEHVTNAEEEALRLKILAVSLNDNIHEEFTRLAGTRLAQHSLHYIKLPKYSKQGTINDGHT